jgi:alpha-L-arabinofuranosidase
MVHTKRSLSGLRFLAYLAPLVVPIAVAVSQPSLSASLTVHADRPGPKISPSLYGIFFEEINHAGDGGLYAELLRNRSFEESSQPVHWRMVKEGMVDAEMAIDSLYSVSEKNEKYLKIKVLLALEGHIGIANSGYWGIAVTKGSSYDCSLYAMALDGLNKAVTVVLEAPDDRILASATLGGISSDWKKLSTVLTVSDDCPNARFMIRILEPGMLFLDMVSLFPKHTFRDRRNGLRPDLAGMLMNLRPAFVRFPGGCWVEGDNLGLAYRWKETIGDIANRRYQYNLWQYHSTNGLGFHEYLQMCEDLGADPLFVINAGMSHNGFVPLKDMKPWVQDALDALEYANGSAESRWGALRARNGHPAPFNLQYIEIGNENGGPIYDERYALFHDAIKAKYPNVQLIANVWGGYPKNRPVSMIDEHYYASSRFFIDNATKYDSYDRKGPKVYVGEYAVTQGCGNGNLRAALGEAAFMTGMERNSDVVVMSSYAPLFANVNDKKWNPDLINFNATDVYGTPSYYVQEMFSRNRGDVVLPIDLEVEATPPEVLPARNGKVGVGTWNTQSEFREIKVIKDGQTLYASDFETGAKEWTPVGGEWKLVDGYLRQAAGGSNRRAVTGDSTWSDYTYTLKARKLGGAEGFLILFSVKSGEDFVWWNIGGWGNTRHAIEVGSDGGKSIAGKEVTGSVETGRWYDVRVELKGQNVKCYLDGNLIHDLTYDDTAPKSLHVVAGRQISSGDIILKIVNVSKYAVATAMKLKGVASVSPSATSVLLTSTDVRDENSLEEPRKVVPKRLSVDGISENFKYVFAPHSITVLRLNASR